jgi:hypothetical protein
LALEVKDAVAIAIDYVQKLFGREALSNLGLEEVEADRDENLWLVTVGFSRPWDLPKGDASRQALFPLPAPEPQPRRDYKVVRIEANTGKVLSVKNRSVDQ